MASKRHVWFNVIIVAIPWLSLLFINKRDLKRFSLASFIIGVVESLYHVYGHNRNWWKFYDKPKSFMRDELPFDIGPYIPLSIWILKYSYGNFKKFALLNAVVNALFSFLFIPFLKKMKIIRLHRLNHFQFFLYIHHKAYLLYGVQRLLEKGI